MSAKITETVMKTVIHIFTVKDYSASIYVLNRNKIQITMCNFSMIYVKNHILSFFLFTFNTSLPTANIFQFLGQNNVPFSFRDEFQP